MFLTVEPSLQTFKILSYRALTSNIMGLIDKNVKQGILIICSLDLLCDVIVK